MRRLALLLPLLALLALGGCLQGAGEDAALVAGTDGTEAEIAPEAEAADGDEEAGEDAAEEAAAEEAVAEEETPEPAAMAEPVDMRVFLPPPAPLPPILRERQTACERDGGRLVQRGRTGLYDCLRQTGDPGRRCERATDCEGACLARSNSCAPMAPLLGCHEVLDGGGTRVTVCLE